MLRTAQLAAAHTPSEAFHALLNAAQYPRLPLRSALRSTPAFRCARLHLRRAYCRENGTLYNVSDALFLCCALYGRMAHVGRFLARLVALGTAQCALLYNVAHCATQLTKKNVDAATQNEKKC